ncbi:hypothetical protein [Actinomyces dentalis]|uniref:hypothetical protein n=1 Tax=Actinomyces dentalis TaxID=272548 RepID=UPI0028F065C5|nr:hypothetical protein [Actinomyces dentalis]
MTLLIHVVGASDLGIDIRQYPANDRKSQLGRRLEEVQSLLGAAIEDESASESLVDALLDGGEGEFSLSPLAQEVKVVLQSECSDTDYSKSSESSDIVSMHLILVASSVDRDPSDGMVPVANFLRDSVALPRVRALLFERLGARLTVEVVSGELKESENLKHIRRILSAHCDERRSEPVYINAMSGSTIVLLSVLAAVDQEGLPWRSIMASGEERLGMRVWEPSISSPRAVAAWLLAQGYVLQAIKWAKMRDVEDESVFTQEVRAVADIVSKLSKDVPDLTDGELARLTCLWLLRGDNGAGLAVRAWVKAHYEAVLARENAAREESGEKSLSSMFELASAKRRSELGPVICWAKREGRDSDADRWLAGQGDLNDIGKCSTHDFALPSSKDMSRIRAERELSDFAPGWMPWPGRRPVLYIYGRGCGRGTSGTVDGKPVPSFPERILLSAPQPELRRAAPGGMLSDKPPLPIVFRILHSDKSSDEANEDRDILRNLVPDKGWNLTDVEGVLRRYEAPADRSASAEAEIVNDVSVRVKKLLAETSPAAVVLVGSGQKGVVFGALRAAQSWCGQHAVPLFLQTFVDPAEENVEAESQFHRFALHADAEAALLEVAAAGLDSLNLLSAARALSAGDQDMDELAEQCDDLRRKYVKAANNKNDPDSGAGTILDLLETVADLWDNADWETQMRLTVVAAEAVSFKQNRKLLIRNTGLGSNGDLARRRLDRSGNGNGASHAGADGVRTADHRDLLQIIYEMRNRVILTHGGSAPQAALESVMESPKDSYSGPRPFVVDAAGLTYPDLLRLTCKRIREIAGTGKHPKVPQSDWKRRFMFLREDIGSRLKRARDTMGTAVAASTGTDMEESSDA